VRITGVFDGSPRTSTDVPAQGYPLSQATVTSILNRLEKKGYVERERSTVDKRKVHVHLTERGFEILRDAPIPLQEQFARGFNDLQEWEQTMIISSLQRVAYMMDAEHIDASPVLDVGALDRPLESPTTAETLNRSNPAIMPLKARNHD
jgi:DNA-binding transcriptional MocR family regulator